MWQRELLLDAAVRLVVGCEEAMWEAVLPCTIAMVKALEVSVCRLLKLLIHTFLKCFKQELRGR